MSSISQSRTESGTLDAATRSVLAEVDKSLRLPILFFVVCAIIWLTLSSVLALITSFQSYSSDFLAGCEWVTYGRLYPVAINAMLFGWGCNAIFAVALWIIARLSQSPVNDRGLQILNTNPNYCVCTHQYVGCIDFFKSQRECHLYCPVVHIRCFCLVSLALYDRSVYGNLVSSQRRSPKYCQ